MLKKLGIVGVGVAATLVAAAPLASATEGGHHDGGHDKGSHSSHGGGSFNGGSCDFTGGTGEGSSSGDAKGLAAVSGATVGGLGGSNIGNIADCSSFLNNNLNGNSVLSGNTLDVL